MKVKNDLPEELRALVKSAVALLGEVIKREIGAEGYEQVERLRRQMASLRGASSEKTHAVLTRALSALRAMGSRERFELAHAYGLMLEVMNACENAYRTHRLALRPASGLPSGPDAIIYVLTAHPTEARSPQNIGVFHAMQQLLRTALERGFEPEREQLRHLIELAWRVPVARRHKPSVADEAEHVYSILLREEVLPVLLDTSRCVAPFYVRTWVGGDKDGHPGVDADAMLTSLQLSREHLAKFALRRIAEARAALRLIQARDLERECARLGHMLRSLRRVRAGDGGRLTAFRDQVREFARRYRDNVGAQHPALTQLQSLLHMFPALVVPLELRESSDVIVDAATGRTAAITGMLERLASLSSRGEPGWYARGFIISMASDISHVRAACFLVERALGGLRIPVIPLFEQREALLQSSRVVREMLAYPPLRRAVDRYWSGYFEVMLGYSDSAKEVGVLSSRMAIAEAVAKLDRICRDAGVKPLFFHGSGGSVDRGGGSIQEQTAWWPRSALRVYKATIQGEMIERSFASPEIARGQLERIAQQAASGEANRHRASLELKRFAKTVREAYQQKIHSPEFLEIVQKATAYRYLSALKIGSRPSKRGAVKSVLALRAIPWVLCWTQTRVLFPTWWGVGRAWKGSTLRERAAIRRAYESDALFRSYVKLLGFTLAKVELGVWRIYLESSRLSPELIRSTLKEFEREYRDACAFVRAISRSRDLLWFRPWLGTSIRLRAPMIHPLNLIQLLALEEGADPGLIRETVTGISSGMMTTG